MTRVVNLGIDGQAIDPRVAIKGSVRRSTPVTLSDTADLNNVSEGILVDVAGLVKITYVGGQTDTTQLAAGIWHPINATRIWSTGTTATGVHVY